jgi:PEGA domain
MSRRLPFFGSALALIAAISSGCVDRRFIIESDPPGAAVYVNDRLVGASPVNQSFLYYGKYRFVFVRDGYETLTVDEQICTPWWSYFPLEFVVENILPNTIRDKRYIHKQLLPRQEIPPEAILGRGEQLRTQAQTLGPPDGLICVPGNPAPGTVAVPAPAPQLPPPTTPSTPVPVVPTTPMPQ